MPPKATGNNRPVNMIGLENVTPLGGYLYKKFKKMPQGMGGYKLCKRCNNLTGSWYAESYIDFSNHVNKVMRENTGSKDVEIRFNIKPLNFLKQVVCLLLCADQATGTLRNIISKTNFILNKEEKKLPERLFISQKFTLQPTYAFKGYIPSWESENVFSSAIEFVYRPFYFKATFEPQEIDTTSTDLLDYAKYDYDQEVEIVLLVDLSKFKRQ